jgi:hypothetical protein
MNWWVRRARRKRVEGTNLVDYGERGHRPEGEQVVDQDQDLVPIAEVGFPLQQAEGQHWNAP